MNDLIDNWIKYSINYLIHYLIKYLIGKRVGNSIWRRGFPEALGPEGGSPGSPQPVPPRLQMLVTNSFSN